MVPHIYLEKFNLRRHDLILLSIKSSKPLQAVENFFYMIIVQFMSAYSFEAESNRGFLAVVKVEPVVPRDFLFRVAAGFALESELSVALKVGHALPGCGGLFVVAEPNDRVVLLVAEDPRLWRIP